MSHLQEWESGRAGEWESGRVGVTLCANKLTYEANKKQTNRAKPPLEGTNPPTHLSQTYPKGKVI